MASDLNGRNTAHEAEPFDVAKVLADQLSNRHLRHARSRSPTSFWWRSLHGQLETFNLRTERADVNFGHAVDVTRKGR